MLEGIGAISSDELEAVLASGMQYQDNVLASLPRRKDDVEDGEGEKEAAEAAGDDEGLGDTTFSVDDDPKLLKALNWMEKVCLTHIPLIQTLINLCHGFGGSSSLPARPHSIVKHGLRRPPSELMNSRTPNRMAQQEH